MPLFNIIVAGVILCKYNALKAATFQQPQPQQTIIVVSGQSGAGVQMTAGQAQQLAYANPRASGQPARM